MWIADPKLNVPGMFFGIGTAHLTYTWRKPAPLSPLLFTNA